MHSVAALGAAIVVMLVSLIGVIFSSSALKNWVHRNLTYLATFSAGVFVTVVVYLLRETFTESSSRAFAAGSILFGAALMLALQRLMPESHHHHDAQHNHAHSRIDGRRVLLSDAFHNIGDGVLLAAAFAVDMYVGLAATFGIILHELVQEISEFFILKESGYTTSEALVRNFLSSATILIGVGISAYLGSAEMIALLFAGIAAGGFLTILVQDLIPHAVSSIREKGGVQLHLASAGAGIILMLVVQMLFAH